MINTEYVAYMLGKEAYKHGKPCDIPQDLNPKAGAAWFDGFMDAQSDDLVSYAPKAGECAA